MLSSSQSISSEVYGICYNTESIKLYTFYVFLLIVLL